MSYLMQDANKQALELELVLVDFLQVLRKVDLDPRRMMQLDTLVDSLVTTLLSITDMLSQVKILSTRESGLMT